MPAKSVFVFDQKLFLIRGTVLTTGTLLTALVGGLTRCVHPTATRFVALLRLLTTLRAAWLFILLGVALIAWLVRLILLRIHYPSPTLSAPHIVRQHGADRRLRQ
jgi:hypothetical protein